MLSISKDIQVKNNNNNYYQLLETKLKHDFALYLNLTMYLVIKEADGCDKT